MAYEKGVLSLMKMTIKIASHADDMLKVHEIRRMVFVNEQGVPKELEFDQVAAATNFIGQFAGKNVATGRFRKLSEGVKFERIATLKEFRGQGLGAELMRFMVDEAVRRYPGELLFMNSQESAVGFYEKLGWSVQGQMFKEAGIPHFRMVYTN